jgi:esterase/lipase
MPLPFDVRSRFPKTRFLVGVCLLILLSACTSAPNTPYYQPSPVVYYDFEGDKRGDFGAYIRHTRQELSTHRVPLLPDQAQQEVDQVAPFVMPRPSHCGAPTQGVLLVHGLLDSAYALQDIGRVLAEQCALVYGLLLPGHGTRAADLIDIHRAQWLEAVQFGVRALSQQTADVTVVGFSLGGALATQVAWQDPRVKRLVLLAPALQVAYPLLSSQAVWLRYLRDWVDLDPPYMSVRYQSMPTQAVAQTYQLSRELRANLSQRPLAQPTFLLLAAHDLVIDAPTSLAVFSQNMPNPQSQAWVYGAMDKPSQDARVRQIPVADDRQKIVSYSHVTLPFSPQNPLFGEKGKHKECGLHIGIVAAADAQACLASTDNWKGEIGTNNKTQKPFQRLSYHPRFEDMMTAVSAFMAK